MRKILIVVLVFLIASVAIYQIVHRDAALESSYSKEEAPSVLPAHALKQALTMLETKPIDPEILPLLVRQVPDGSALKAFANDREPIPVPFIDSTTVLIQLRPDLTSDELSELMSDFDLRAIRTFPEIGLMLVSVQTTDDDKGKTSLRSITELSSTGPSVLVESLLQDRRVTAASVDSYLSSLVMKSAVAPETKPVPGASNPPDEQPDWGSLDIEIDDEWSKLNSSIQVGVIDVGFGPHTDLDTKNGLNQAPRVHNHGTHVAGTICAKHDGIGYKGALPNCTVVKAVGTTILEDFSPVEGYDNPADLARIIAWTASFSEYIGTVLEFMIQNPDVKVINLSVGYNWHHNFSIDPRADKRILDIIRNQGRMSLALLEYAAKNDTILVSAAGNDSVLLRKPLEAKWGSPFNFGADLMEASRRWSNGLVVQAHDKRGRRASFSNVSADISCPGVDIYSTLAIPRDSYGSASGTSMAAPYCAAGIVALRSQIPTLSIQQVVRCLQTSSVETDGVARLKVPYAIAACTRNLNRSSDLNQRLEALQTWSDSLVDDDLGVANQLTGCAYNEKRSFTVAEVAPDLGDGQPPTITDQQVRTEVQDFIRELIAQSCRDPILVVMPQSFSRDQYEFALAVMSEFYAARYPSDVLIVEYPLRGRAASELSLRLGQIIVVVGGNELRSTLLK